MLVAVAATFILVLFLSQIFSSMSGGVSLGMATSDVIQSNLTFSRQVGDDASKMVGPLGNGFLVILQKEYQNVVLRRDRPELVNVRSDQLVWVRHTAGLQPRTPRAYNSFEDATSTAPYVRIWYGHVTLTDEAGWALDGAVAIKEPWGPLNVPASNWVVGRHALFLDAGPFPGSIHIDWFAVGRPVQNYPPPPPPEVMGWPGGRELYWYTGLSDISNVTLAGALPATAAEYPGKLYEITFGADRLWCNPNLIGVSPAVWQVAQGHSYLLGNVSDFQVSFAGDYLDIPFPPTPPFLPGQDAEIDVIDGKMIWYGDDADPREFVDPASGGGALLTSAVDDRPDNGWGGLMPQYNADRAFVWGPGAAAFWPHLIRIRYRVHDRAGKLADENGRPGKFFERIIRVRDLRGLFDPQ
jgi:hypothetical protein